MNLVVLLYGPTLTSGSCLVNPGLGTLPSTLTGAVRLGTVGTMNTLSADEPAEGGPTPSDAPTRTLEKGLYLLSLFDIDHPEWTLKALREKAGFPKATTRRLMKTLEASHWVAYDAETGRYHLGSSVLRALYLATSHSELVRAAHPYLLRLEEETTESSSLSVWTDQGPLILDTVPTTRPFKPFTFVGMLLSGCGSADAQILLSFGPEHIREATLAVPQQRRTDHTIVDPSLLRERLRRVRLEGVSLEREEWRPGVAGVAAPVFDQNGDIRASLSVVHPIERGGEAEMQSYAKAVKRAAAELSADLGYPG